jgi:hypothetical protein
MKTIKAVYLDVAFALAGLALIAATLLMLAHLIAPGWFLTAAALFVLVLVSSMLIVDAMCKGKIKLV